MIFDTHAHYDDEAFDADREELLASMRSSGVDKIINVCADLESLDKTEQLMNSHTFIYGAFGIHPDETGNMDETVVECLHRKCRQEKTVAVGEIGLDYYWDKEHHDRQIYWFERQMQLAREEKLPVIVHSRDAALDTLEVMKKAHAEEIGGVIHCFAYSLEMAKAFLDLGFYLGIGGVVTFKNAKKIKDVVANVPLDRILLETDSPYLSPEPNRGKRNSSLNLPYIIDMISELQQISHEEVIQATQKNAENLFLRRTR